MVTVAEALVYTLRIHDTIYRPKPSLASGSRLDHPSVLTAFWSWGDPTKGGSKGSCLLVVVGGSPPSKRQSKPRGDPGEPRSRLRLELHSQVIVWGESLPQERLELFYGVPHPTPLQKNDMIRPRPYPLPRNSWYFPSLAIIHDHVARQTYQSYLAFVL